MKRKLSAHDIAADAEAACNDKCDIKVPVCRVEKGLRHVEPYEFDFVTFVKKRWLGRTLFDVFTKEFIAYSADYYKSAIESGRVTVNGQKVNVDRILKNGERIVHRAVCCQENPVLDRGLLPIIEETADLLVVCKPGSVPIHACGSYRYNCLIAILRAQNAVAEETKLFPTHRLDRLTSGLVIFAKTKDAARRVGNWFTSNQIRKTYLARVRGNVKDLFEKVRQRSLTTGAVDGDGTTCEEPRAESADIPLGISRTAEGRILIAGHIICLCHKVGKYTFSAEKPAEGVEAKYAATEMEFVGQVAGEAIVRCYPLTGRTHQIRVHLQHIGHPIANDVNYGGELRNDAYLPLIPHAQNLLRDSPDAGSANSPIEVKMFSSGIFLHAERYALPTGEYRAETPQWAECG